MARWRWGLRGSWGRSSLALRAAAARRLGLPGLPSCSRYRSYPRCRGWRYYGATDVAGCAPLPGLPILPGLPGLPLPPGLPVLTPLPKLPVLPRLLPPPAVPAEPGRRAQGGKGACRRTLFSVDLRRKLQSSHGCLAGLRGAGAAGGGSGTAGGCPGGQARPGAELLEGLRVCLSL